MPLPAALAAKLSKRGLYLPPTPQKPEKERKRDYKGVVACPNKNNIFHDCTQWCENHWKATNLPPPNYMRYIGKLIQKYSLPRHWTEVFDKGIKRYYYWNMETDIVSWLPPKHPKAVLTESAARLREKRIKGEIAAEERVVYKVTDEKANDRKRPNKSNNSRRDRDRNDGSDKRHKHDDKSHHRRRPHKDDKIDPMDPASYSDIPVGTWSDGLESNKTGVDSTASGALYQQRPYPSPGDILLSKPKSKKN